MFLYTSTLWIGSLNSRCLRLSDSLGGERFGYRCVRVGHVCATSGKVKIGQAWSKPYWTFQVGTSTVVQWGQVCFRITTAEVGCWGLIS